MALITLKDIGKIYVSEGNVAVGIRGVNLSFDRGEFVAVTGKSGSGKSTLLNVISGMDSYEEGELFIEDQPTSHYLQPEWEEYRERYISFIFQDYNIIESFTVLQNVELALMHIEDKKTRRLRALELIKRVGLSKQIKQKGSKLSGGQKQRTVIARALAKDSPIILADEPTGNLDYATSKEIIALLKEISTDKLLIVVTHNFEQLEECATRHIRIFDGAVEADHVIRPTEKKQDKITTDEKNDRNKETKKLIKNGFTLGRSIFTSKPKLSIFLCFLMIIGSLGIFFITSACGDAAEMFEPYYMFNHIDGRVIIAKRNGANFTDSELIEIKNKYGALDYLHVDTLLDGASERSIVIPTSNNENEYDYAMANIIYGKDYGDDIIGRYPEKENEVFLYLPIYYQTRVGKTEIKVPEVVIGSTNYKLVGVKYYYDNNLLPECLLTENGFRTATAIHYLYQTNPNITVNVTSLDNENFVPQTYSIHNIIPSFDMPADKVYINDPGYRDFYNKNSNAGIKTEIQYFSTYYKYDYVYGDANKSYRFEKTFTDKDITNEKPNINNYESWRYDSGIIISDELFCEIAESILNESYKQASLFFENDKAAHEAAEKLQYDGFIAVPSDTTYEPDAFTTLSNILACIVLFFVWGLSILFLAFFINLCSTRTLGAFKGDMAIMRSMGIPVNVIRIGMYVRMLFSLIPAFILVIATALLIFTSPKFNEYFVYLYGWQYALIFIGMILLTAKTTHNQIKRLFGESVKKSLKGGNAE